MQNASCRGVSSFLPTDRLVEICGCVCIASLIKYVLSNPSETCHSDRQEQTLNDTSGFKKKNGVNGEPFQANGEPKLIAFFKMANQLFQQLVEDNQGFILSKF